MPDRPASEVPDFSRVVTTTTRSPREGEIDGVDYWFLSPPEFRNKISNGEFLEWASIHGDHETRLYGTLMKSVIMPLNEGQNLVMNVNVQGVKSIKNAAKTHAWLDRALVTVFIRVDLKKLEARMRERDKDHPEEIVRRLETAEAELRETSIFAFVIESGTRDEDFASVREVIRHRLEMSAA